MKAIKTLRIALCLFFGSIGAMVPSSPTKKIQTEVQIFFTPSQIEQLNTELHKLLDNAKEQVLVAMYWITDENIINKLVALKMKGIDVQVIFDESTMQKKGEIDEKLMNSFTENNIIPLIFPSVVLTKMSGLMHNKFLIIDGNVVWTGSANFTKTALDPNMARVNDENVIILRSEYIAKKYIANFRQMQMGIKESYINLLTHFPLNELENELPRWLLVLTNKLKKFDQSFVNKLNQEPSFKQKALLAAKGRYQEGMSKQEASKVIGQIMQQEKSLSRSIKPATQWQKNFLLEHGISAKGLSYHEAYEMIGELQEQERRQRLIQQKRSHYYQKSEYQRKRR